MVVYQEVNPKFGANFLLKFIISLNEEEFARLYLMTLSFLSVLSFTVLMSLKSHGFSYLKEIETLQINNLRLHLQELEEQQQTKPRASRRKEVTKIRAELNDIEIERTIQRIHKSRSYFFEKINKIDKTLSRLIKPWLL